MYVQKSESYASVVMRARALNLRQHAQACTHVISCERLRFSSYGRVPKRIVVTF